MRYWFPVALGVLFLLALPAAVLFALDLSGYEGDVNHWLEQHFNISHRVPLADWAAGLLFLVPPLVVLLYFLRLKRKTTPVPSTFLWKKSIEDLHVNRLMQWLRRNVLLLLQLLVILMILYAIIGPRLHGERTSGRHYILLIDNSASMSATDQTGAEDRLAWAKAEALKEIDAATDDDFGMVIVFNSAAEIRQSYTSNKGLLRAAVSGIGPTQRPTRIDEALRLAESLANPSRSTEDEAARPADPEVGKERTYVPVEGIPTEVHLYSDGRFPDVPDFALSNLDVRFHLAGEGSPGENLGVANLDAIRAEDDPGQVQVFARVLNSGEGARPVRVRLDVFVDGELSLPLDRRVTVPGRSLSTGFVDPTSDTPETEPGEARLIFELSDLDRDADVRVRLRLEADDPFPLDDEAWLVMGLVRKARVAVIGPGNPVLEFFFDSSATRSLAEVTYLKPDQLSDPAAYLDPARDGAFDLVIFDRCAPASEADMPRANTCFVGRPPPQLGTIADLEMVEFPQVRGWSDEHAVMRGLGSWDRLELAEAFRLPELPPRTPRLLEGDRNLVLMAAVARGAYTDLVLAFALQDDEGKWNTRWFMSPSFVLFMRNMLYAMGNVRDASTEEAVRPGEVKRFWPAAAVDVIRVETPDGRTVRLDRGKRAEFLFGDAESVGVYLARWDGGGRAFAVNLFDEGESDLRPRARVMIGSEQVTAGEGRGQPRELWKWAVLAGLIFLLVEWYVYNRRVHV